MKIFVPLSIVLTILISGCGKSSKPSQPRDILAPETRLRSELDRTWTLCRVEDEGSIQILVDIRGSTISISALTHKDSECKSTDFETFRLATYTNSDLVTANRYSGTSALQLTVYYPTQRNLEDGVVKFGGDRMHASLATFSLDAESKKLNVTLSQIKTEGGRELSESQTLAFDRLETALPEQIGEFRYQYLLGKDDKYTFGNQDGAISWLRENATTAVAIDCVEDYLIGQAQPFPESDSIIKALFESDLKHPELNEKGFMMMSFSTHFFESKDHKLYLGLIFDYADSAGQGSTEGIPSLVCPITTRFPGVAVSPN